MTPHSYSRKKTSKNFLHILLLLALLLIFVGMIHVVWNMYGRYKESSERRQSIEEEYSLLVDRIEYMESSVASFKTIEGKERVVRNSFDLAKEGEKVLIILEKEADDHVVLKKKSWYRRVFGFIGFGE